MHLACISSNTAMVKKLLTRPELLVQLQDSQGNTPVHKAANALADEIILLLVERNPVVTKVTNNKGQTCMD